MDTCNQADLPERVLATIGVNAPLEPGLSLGRRSQLSGLNERRGRRASWACLPRRVLANRIADVALAAAGIHVAPGRRYDAWGVEVE